MKRRILLFTLIFTMLLSAFMLANSVSAECTSQKGKDVATSATITSSSTDPFVRPELLVDGNTTNGTFCMYGTFTFTFSEQKQISDVRVYLNSNSSSATAYTASVDVNQNVTYSPVTVQGKYVASVKVEFFNASDEVVWSSGDVDVKDVNNRIDISSIDSYSVKKVVISIGENGSLWGKCPIFEVKIYESSGLHDWKLDETVNTTEQPYVPATCTEDGMGTYKCECGSTKYDTVYSTGHITGSYYKDLDNPGNHYKTCINYGKCSLEPGTKLDYKPCEYDHECDTTCDLCGYERTVEGHLYVSDCDVRCNKCNELRQPVGGAQHVFAYTCTPECANCREPNPNWVNHTYDSDCDVTCNFCQTERIVNPHVYNSECDEDCNVQGCGFVRTTVDDPSLIPHAFTSDCDTNCNNENCVYVRQPLTEHPFQNKCDKNCNACNALNPDYVEGHVYDNACDDRCNECPVKRTVDDHKYDNACDIDCNTCGTQRTVSKHIYGDWITLVPASETAEGIRAHYCVNCDKEEQETLPMLDKTGLSTGAIVGIVAGSSVVVLGCAGIGVYSLVIKPKMELKQRQALEAEKKKAQEADDDDEYDDDEEYEDDEDSES